jgi:hypothetical protein
MDRKSWLLLGFAVVLAGVYATFFTEWFHSPPIEVLPQIRETIGRGARRGAASGTLPVTFALDDSYHLSSVKVIAVTTNSTKAPEVMWQLTSATNSAPTKAIFYGRQIGGMKPVPDNSGARPLAPGVHYKILVVAGRRQGEAVFHTYEAPPSQ